MSLVQAALVQGTSLIILLVPVTLAPVDPAEVSAPAGVTYADVERLLRDGAEFITELRVDEGYLIVLRQPTST